MSTNLLENTCKLESSTGMINVEVVCMIMLYLYTSSVFFLFSPLQECCMECGCGSAISGSIRGLNFTVLKAHALIHYWIILFALLM